MYSALKPGSPICQSKERFPRAAGSCLPLSHSWSSGLEPVPSILPCNGVFMKPLSCADLACPAKLEWGGVLTTALRAFPHSLASEVFLLNLLSFHTGSYDSQVSPRLPVAEDILEFLILLLLLPPECWGGRRASPHPHPSASALSSGPFHRYLFIISAHPQPIHPSLGRFTLHLY